MRFQPSVPPGSVSLRIKQFDVAMEIKNKGIEINVCDTDGTHRGDLFITKTKLIWCAGKTRRRNGKEITWKTFMAGIDKL